MTDIKRLLWKFLILNGRRVKEESFYGDLYDNPNIPDIEKYLGSIDWKKTMEPFSDVDSMFNGTFNDPIDVNFYAGRLVLLNGKKEYWKYEITSTDFGDIIRSIVKLIEE